MAAKKARIESPLKGLFSLQVGEFTPYYKIKEI